MNSNTKKITILLAEVKKAEGWDNCIGSIPALEEGSEGPPTNIEFEFVLGGTAGANAKSVTLKKTASGEVFKGRYYRASKNSTPVIFEKVE